MILPWARANDLTKTYLIIHFIKLKFLRHHLDKNYKYDIILKIYV